MDKPETISPVVEAAHTRIAQRAYELFLQRDGTNGSAADDWLAAEAELVVRPRVKRYYYHDGMKIEPRLPTADVRAGRRGGKTTVAAEYAFQFVGVCWDVQARCCGGSWSRWKTPAAGF